MLTPTPSGSSHSSFHNNTDNWASGMICSSTCLPSIVPRAHPSTLCTVRDVSFAPQTLADTALELNTRCFQARPNDTGVFAEWIKDEFGDGDICMWQFGGEDFRDYDVLDHDFQPPSQSISPDYKNTNGMADS